MGVTKLLPLPQEAWFQLEAVNGGLTVLFSGAPSTFFGGRVLTLQSKLRFKEKKSK